jgi:hypothetical protein
MEEEDYRSLFVYKIEIELDGINCKISDLEAHLIEQALIRAIKKSTSCELKSIKWFA